MKDKKLKKEKKVIVEKKQKKVVTNMKTGESHKVKSLNPLMVPISKPVITPIWAEAGVVADPGSAKIQEGWVEEIPPREFENFMQNKIGTYLNHINQRGVAEWDAITEYLEGALVLASDAAIYQSKAAGNSGNDPTVALSAFWGKVIDIDESRAHVQNLLIGQDIQKNPFTLGQSFNGLIGDQIIADQIEMQISLGGGGGSYNSEIIDTGGPTVAQAGIFSPDGIRITVNATQAMGVNDLSSIQWVIEGFDYARIAGQEFVFDVWVTASIGGTYCLSLRDGDSGNNNYVTEVVLPAGVLTRIVKPITAAPLSGFNYTNGQGLRIALVLSAGTASQGAITDNWSAGPGEIATSNQINLLSNAAATFDFWLAQTKPGVTAMPFTDESTAETWAKCERYLQKSYNYLTDPGAIQAASLAPGAISAVSQLANGVRFLELRTPLRTTMRDKPIVTWYSIDSGNADAITDIDAGPADYAVQALGEEASVNSVGWPVTPGPVVRPAGNILYCHYVAKAHL